MNKSFLLVVCFYLLPMPFLIAKEGINYQSNLSYRDTIETQSPIPLSYITPQSTKLLAELANAKKEIKRSDHLSTLNNKWKVLNHDLSDYLVVFQEIQFHENNLVILFRHQSELEFWKKEVDLFSVEVINRKNDLNLKFDHYTGLSAKWQSTLNYAQQNEVEKVLVDQVKKVLGELHRIQKIIRKAQAHFVGIDAEVSKRSLDLNYQISDLVAYRASPIYAKGLNDVGQEFDFSNYKKDKIVFYKADWRYFRWILSTTNKSQVVLLIFFFIILQLTFRAAKYNIRYYDYWAEKLVTNGSMRFVFENINLNSLFITLLVLNRVLPGISYLWTFFQLFLLLALLVKMSTGLNLRGTKMIWGIVFLLLFINILILPVNLDNVWNIVGVAICDLLICYLVYSIQDNLRRKGGVKIRKLLFLGYVPPFLSVIGIFSGKNSLIYFPIDVLQDIALFGLFFSVGWRILVMVVPVAFFGRNSFQLQTVFKNKDKIVETIYTWSKYLYAALIVSLILEVVAQKELFYDSVYELVYYPIEIGALGFTVASIVIFGVTLYLISILGKVVTTLLKEDVFRLFKVSSDTGTALVLISRYLFFVLGFFISLGAAGIDFSNLAVIIGAIGVGLGFGLQGLVANFISGLILVAERPFKIGDVLELQDKTVGEVKEIGVRASIIRLFDGAEVIVPNNNLISDRLTNWTFSGKTRRVQIYVGVAYDSDPILVQEVLNDVVKRSEFILNEPEAVVLLDEFADSSINFRILVWTNKSWTITKSEIMLGILKAFKVHKIEIPFPQRDLHIIELPQVDNSRTI